MAGYQAYFGCRFRSRSNDAVFLLYVARIAYRVKGQEPLAVQGKHSPAHPCLQLAGTGVHLRQNRSRTSGQAGGGAKQRTYPVMVFMSICLLFWLFSQAFFLSAFFALSFFRLF